MIRTLAIISIFLFCFLSITAAGEEKLNGAEQQTGKPNFILIVADDLGFADVGFNGSTQIETPNIDHLASSGVRFSQGYVSSAVCSPSRAGLLTGRNQVEFGHDNNLSNVQPGFDGAFNGLPLTEKTIADRLKSLGYVTGLIGKWHLGDLPQFHPLKRGFDEFWGYTGGGHDYFNVESNSKGYLSPIECNYKTPQKLTYITDDKGDECIDFITRHKSEPFFLFASFNAPHAPMQATNDDLQLFEHVKNEKRRKYCAMVHRLDINIGRIMGTLEEQGLSEKTLVVFMSDNGGPCDQNASLNAPLNGQKGILLEGGIHVPFVMNWPGMLTEGMVYNEMVSSLDIAPTFYELAGGKRSAEDKFTGVNLLPYLNGSSVTAPHNELLWRFTISKAIRKGDWKLISIPDRIPMLYNLATDISEQNNVALDHIDVTGELLQELGNWDVSLPHPLFLEGARWKRVQLDLYDRKYQLSQPVQ
nr:sulfatase [uncultured Draconibacterium sp.]